MNEFVTPYEVSKMAGCLPQYCYNLVGKKVGSLGKNAFRNEEGVWQIPSEVAVTWAEADKARKALRNA
jgi:hypothetical protein